MKEDEIFNLIEKRLDEILCQKQNAIRITVNGIEGTGKTVFTKKLTNFLKRNNKKAIQVSIDGFHFDKVYRYKLGRDSARGYYEDAYNEVDFVEKVLIASQKENPKITIATHDLETDEYLYLKPISITNDTIIITDGAYLFKPTYKDYWDLKIYLKTDFQTALNRGMKRDVKLLGGLKATKERYKNRYHKSSEIYINENKPEKLADIIIDNTEFENLKLIKNNPPLSLVRSLGNKDCIKRIKQKLPPASASILLILLVYLFLNNYYNPNN